MSLEADIRFARIGFLHKKPCNMKQLLVAMICLLSSLTADAAPLTEAQRQAADKTIDILTKAYDAIGAYPMTTAWRCLSSPSSTMA